MDSLTVANVVHSEQTISGLSPSFFMKCGKAVKLKYANFASMLSFLHVVCP